jgi:hypothetical protein
MKATLFCRVSPLQAEPTNPQLQRQNANPEIATCFSPTKFAEG